MEFEHLVIRILHNTIIYITKIHLWQYFTRWGNHTRKLIDKTIKLLWYKIQGQQSEKSKISRVLEMRKQYKKMSSINNRLHPDSLYHFTNFASMQIKGLLLGWVRRSDVQSHSCKTIEFISTSPLIIKGI